MTFRDIEDSVWNSVETAIRRNLRKNCPGFQTTLFPFLSVLPRNTIFPQKC